MCCTGEMVRMRFGIPGQPGGFMWGIGQACLWWLCGRGGGGVDVMLVLRRCFNVESHRKIPCTLESVGAPKRIRFTAELQRSVYAGVSQFEERTFDI
jgi:hypothetical protein